MRNYPATLLPLAALLALAAPTTAQRLGGTWDLRRTHDGFTPGMGMGQAVLGVPDLDGDLVPDVVVGAPYADTGAFTDCGQVFAFSGATGALLWVHDGRSNLEHRGSALARAGDWNTDGVMDIAVGSPHYDATPLVDSGLVKIVSGATGTDIYTLPGASSGDLLGSSFAGDFDYEGDGVPDVLIGAPGANYAGVDSGRCYLLSLTTGVTWTYDGPSAGAYCGASVACLGDLDGDTFQDFLVGAPDAKPGIHPEAGQAIAFSGATHATLWNYSGVKPYAHLGHAVAGGRDLDGDGVPDFAFSAPGASPGGRTAAGVVEFRSGAGGTLLRRLAGAAAQDRLGWSLALVADLNHDGRADVLAGGRRAGGEGLVQVHDGSSGVRMQRLLGALPNDAFGASVDAAGDLDGDGESELLIGAPSVDVPGFMDAGAAQIHGFMPCLTSSSATLSVSAGGSVSFMLDFPVSEAGQDYVLLASRTGTGPTIAAGVAIPLTVDPLYLSFLAGTPPPGFVTTTGLLNASGDGAATLTRPAGGPPGLVGRTLWFAAISATPALAPRVAGVAVTLTLTT